MRNLDDFDGEQWLDRGDRLGGSDPELALPDGWEAQAGWRETARVTLRRMQTREVLGTGTTLAVEDSSRIVEPAGEPGVWRSLTDFRGGDSYTIRAYLPRPSPKQLAESGAQEPTRGAPPIST